MPAPRRLQWMGDVVNALMGSKPEARFRFIQDRVAFAHDLVI